MPKALIICTENSEDIETVATFNVLTRLKIIPTLASLDATETVKLAQGVRIVPDTTVDEAIKQKDSYDVLVIPGGSGCKTLAASPKVHELLRYFESSNKVVAIICAAPLCLISSSTFKNKMVTSHFTVKDNMVAAGYSYDDEKRVVRDGNLITSRGPGTTIEFALEIGKALGVQAEVDQQIHAMYVNI